MSSGCKKITLAEKVSISLLSAVLFVVIGSPMLYKLMDSLTTKYGVTIADSNGCPNIKGLAVHGVVFFLVVLLIMQF
jgi:hypothetical protein